tara:strand:- start:850 stop:1170 length:321 start_codon:yes stop_codon:yes gene_type:complete
MRFISKTLSLIFLAIAIIAAVVDALQSVAQGKLSLTPLGATWFNFHSDSLNLSQALIQRYVHPFVWDPIMQWILLQPTLIIFLVLSLIFYMISYKRKSAADRFFAK